MKEPVWITREAILSTQETLLARFGGLAGLRDEGLLDSALHKPMHLFAYGKPRMQDLAAAYAAGIIRNHPFLDGNKRAGFMAAYIFLRTNDLEFTASEEEVCLQTRALAAGEITEADYAVWLKASCKRPRRASRRKPS